MMQVACTKIFGITKIIKNKDKVKRNRVPFLFIIIPYPLYMTVAVNFQMILIIIGNK